MDILLLIGIFTFISLWIFLSIYLLRGFFIDTPYYPSRLKKLDELWSYLEIDPKGKKFIDIGSGDGRTVRWASRKGLASTGIDINPFLTLLSRMLNIFNKSKENAKFINGDFFKESYSDFDIVYLYIYRSAMNELGEKLFNELKPGSIIISNVFGFDDYEPDDKFKRFKIFYVK